MVSGRKCTKPTGYTTRGLFLHHSPLTNLRNHLCLRLELNLASFREIGEDAEGAGEFARLRRLEPDTEHMHWPTIRSGVLDMELAVGAVDAGNAEGLDAADDELALRSHAGLDPSQHHGRGTHTQGRFDLHR